MFETALLSALSPATRSLALPLSIAAHAAVLAVLLGASLWRQKPLARPPTPVVFVSIRPAPPPAGSSTGSSVSAIGSPGVGATNPREIPSSMPAARSLLHFPGEPATDRSGDSGSGSDPGGAGEASGAPQPGESAEAPIVIGGKVRPPRLLDRVEPDYPEAARKGRIEGVVILRAVIDTAGDVEGVDVVKSVLPLLDEAALRRFVDGATSRQR